MKNMLRKMLCCLVAALMMVMPLTTSLAEKGYEGMKYILAQILTDVEGAAVEYNWSENSSLEPQTVSVVFNSDDNGVMLTGYNAEGNQEVCFWEGADILATFLALCSNWETLETLLEDGYALNLTYLGEDAESSIFVTDKETAVSLYEAAMNLVGE